MRARVKLTRKSLKRRIKKFRRKMRISLFKRLHHKVYGCVPMPQDATRRARDRFFYLYKRGAALT